MKLPHSPPEADSVIQSLDPHDFTRVLGHTSPVDSKGRYLHWDEMRNKRPPSGLSREQWWLATEIARDSMATELPLTAVDGTPFHYSNVDAIQEAVHLIDQRASGEIIVDDVVTNLRSSTRYVVSSLVEEAITSSQLEGASTTRKVAKKMLQSGRQPRDRSEQMILNNYRAMLWAQEMVNERITPELVLELHRIVTTDALDDPDDAGRLQTADEKRIAVYWHDNTLLHAPPHAQELPARLEALCKFANGETPKGFLHPVVRAILLHLWLAYDHPFVDGNGRTSRALFYWQLLNQGYWLAQYFSVSSILRKAQAQYVRSFLHVETDRYDATYFILYQLSVIARAMESLHDYLARKIEETREIEALIHGSERLNNRQLLVIRDALRDPSEQFTIKEQQITNRVTYESARSDLLDLENLGLLRKSRQGKKFVFRAVEDLPSRLKKMK